MTVATDYLGEIIKSKTDPVYFINNYVYIKDANKGNIPFKLWDFQCEIINSFKDNQIILVNKGRQLGVTSTLLAYSLWVCMFHSHKNVLVVSQREQDAADLLDNIRYMYDFLPDFIKPNISKDSRTKIEFPKLYSIIQALPSSSSTGRGKTASFVLVDELAYLPKDEHMWSSLAPTISAGGKLAGVSTPNGVGNLFHKLWVNPDSDIKTIPLDWQNHPERDEEWAKKEKRRLGPKLFKQEHELSFIQSGTPVFDASYLKISTQPQPPKPSNRYIIGADVAEGLKDGDYSAAVVLNRETFEQVNMIRGKWPPDIYAQKLQELGNQYNQALIVVERNNHGHTTLLRLNDLGYKNLYTDQKGKQGWLTQSTNKSNMIDNLEELLRKEELLISSEDILNELMIYQHLDTGKFGAPSGYHDDLVIALAIAVSVAMSNVGARSRKKKPRGW